MPVYKFTWSQEFGWDDWRDMEWTTRAKNEREAWLCFYEDYGVWEHYIEWLEKQSDEEIEIDEDELWKTVKIEELDNHANWMEAEERLRDMITGAKISKI